MDYNQRARGQKRKSEPPRQRQERRAAPPQQSAKKPQQPPRKGSGANHAPVFDQDAGRAAQPARTAPRGNRQRTLTITELRRRTRRRRLITLVMILTAVVAGLAISMMLLFRVTAIEVVAPDGTQPADTGVYSEEQIIAALGISIEDNIFSFSVPRTEERLALALPLLEQTTVARRYPGTVQVIVEPAQATYCAKTGAGWVLLSKSLRIMELSTQKPSGLIVLLGSAEAGVPGTALSWHETVAGTDDEGNPTEEVVESTAHIDLLRGLEEVGLLNGVGTLDLTVLEETGFLYEDRIAVKLGTLNELSYKLRLAAYILHNTEGKGLSETDVGVLDVSHIRTDGTIQPVFRTGTPLLPWEEAVRKEEEAAIAAAVAEAGEDEGEEGAE